jgi:tRNA(adenine34) deaminase
LIYGAEEPKGGAVRSCFAIFEHPAVNHRMEVINNVLAADAAALLKDFFVSRR